jgi:hypothetical protein
LRNNEGRIGVEYKDILIEQITKDETRLTIKLLRSNPKKLKDYLLSNYLDEINEIKRLLTIYFDSNVDVHYTFEDFKTLAWNGDLDFYFLDNKEMGYEVVDAGKRKLPVCFVIMPPISRRYKKDIYDIKDEGIYMLDKHEKMKWLYHGLQVKDMSWYRIFNKAINKLR